MLQRVRAHAREISFGILTAALVAGAAFVFYHIVTMKGQGTEVCVRYGQVQTYKFSPPRAQCELSLERAETNAAREQGLSGRYGLAGDQGMLFVFDGIGRQCMWMKDMKFSIDMLWLDTSGTVTKIEENLSPETYPNEYCGDNSAFVIEIGAGRAKAFDFKTGSHFDL